MDDDAVSVIAKRATAIRLTLCGLASVIPTACSPQNDISAIGDAGAGAIVITRMACGSCHRIPGIEEADGRVGPSLEGFARRTIIAGHLDNNAKDLRHYLIDPGIVGAGNVMPGEELNDRQARDVAAYLYTLR